MTTAPSTLGAFVATVRTNWKVLLQAGTWVLALVGAFVLPPPVWDAADDIPWLRFAHFLAAALTGLLYIPTKRFSAKRHLRGWFATSVVLLVSATALLFAYQATRANWTRPYHRHRVVVGSTYTDDALAYRAKIRAAEQREISDDDLIMDYAGAVESIWLPAEVRSRRLGLAAIYILLIVLFTAFVISLVQALYLMRQGARAGQRRTV
jgi:hypothetical protein